MRGSDATRELKEHMKWGQMDVAVVKRLLDDNLQDYADSAVIWAIQEEELEVLRLMCASWPDMDCDPRWPLMQHAASLCRAKSTICLFKLGFEERESNCQRVVTVMLARRVWTSAGIFKDIAQLLGRVVWQSRRKEEWDSEEMRQGWHEREERVKELERWEDE